MTDMQVVSRPMPLSAAVARGALVAAVLDEAMVGVSEFNVNPIGRDGVLVQIASPRGGDFDRARAALGFGDDTVEVSTPNLVYARGVWNGIHVELYANACDAGYAKCSCGCGHVCQAAR